MNYYFITLTQPTGLSDSLMCELEKWFDKFSGNKVVTREQHKSGLWHMHAMVQDPVKQTAGLSRRLKRYLVESNDFDVAPKNAVDVRKVKSGDETRTAGYIAKEDHVYTCVGWSIKSLLEQRAKELRKQVSAAPKSTFMLNEKNAEEIILEYALRMSMPLTCKEEFIDVMTSMAEEGYSVTRIKPTIVYAQVMARAGSPAHMRDWWQMKLGFQM